MSFSHHAEKHYIGRLGWLRASVLGANDGIISVTSLVAGMAASGVDQQILLITCVAGWISGALSMAAGEYVSVKSQEDIEKSDLAMETRELKKNPDFELKELTNIYVHRGLDPALAHEVAVQLTAHDALAAHARDEIGINDQTAAQPTLAAVSSAVAFSCGALLPTLAVICIPIEHLHLGVMVVGVVALAILGMISSYLSGTSLLKGATRIMVWGIVAMFVTSLIGSFFEVSI